MVVEGKRWEEGWETLWSGIAGQEKVRFVQSREQGAHWELIGQSYPGSCATGKSRHMVVFGMPEEVNFGCVMKCGVEKCVLYG
jgi:hypothetical protein